MVDPALLVALSALVLAAVWIVYLQSELLKREEVLDDVEEALDNAHSAIDRYHSVMFNVAIGHTKLGVAHDGTIIATDVLGGEVQIH